MNDELTNDEPTRDVFALEQPGDTAATVAAAAATTAPSDEAAGRASAPSLAFDAAL
jgi:hypothetical protein